MASSTLTMRVEGGAELVKALDRLPDKLLKRVVQGAVRKGARRILSSAKGHLDKGHGIATGTYRRALTVRQKTYRGQVVVAVVGAKRETSTVVYQDPRPGRQPRERRENPANISHLIEYGTVHAAAIPHLRPAFDTEGPAAGQLIKSEVEKNAGKLLDAS